LYAATSAAVDAFGKDRRAINTVVLITDGANEDEHNDNRSALLAHLGARPNVHVVTIAYGPDADVSTLRKIAQVTDDRFYDARDPAALFDVLPAAFAGF
jgi:Ca-activated chloride channel family protein